MDRDLKELKWELTHETYIKEKFAKHYSWFMQLEEKIQSIDRDIIELKSLMKKISDGLNIHKTIVSEEIHKKPNQDDTSIVKGLTFFDKIFKKKGDE